MDVIYLQKNTLLLLNNICITTHHCNFLISIKFVLVIDYFISQILKANLMNNFAVAFFIQYLK